MPKNPLIKDDGTHAVTGETLTAAEVRRRQIATSMKSPEHLMQWLTESGHGWLVMRTDELVKSLPWPGGVETVIDLVNLYTDYRRTIDSGRRELQKEPVTGEQVEVVVYKDQDLEVEELDRVIRWLTGKIYQIKPDWSLEDAPL